MQVAKIRLAATGYLQTCCKLLKHVQLASSLWITSLDKSVVATCSKSVERIKSHPVCENQTCCNLIFSDLLQIVETTCLSNNKSCQSKPVRTRFILIGHCEGQRKIPCLERDLNSHLRVSRPALYQLSYRANWD